VKKEQLLFRDRLVKGINSSRDIKISVVKTTDLVKEAQRRHQLSPIATLQLGKALTGVVLLASELK
jgi:molecular chaperone Hsp33